MPILSDSQHEAFAQARFAGKTLVEAHYAAGYAGDKASAFKLNQLFEVKERIAELYREAATQTIYEKTHAVRDLLAIIHACAADANAENPLCESRLGKNGTYYRFPPKLQAMARLIKLMDWDQPVDLPQSIIIQHEPATPTPDTPLSDPIAPINPIADGDDPDTTPEPDFISESTADQPLTPRQEAFANSRVRGLGVMAAYHAAGYTGDSPNLAWRLNSMPEIQARIAELNGGVEAATGYGKDDAVRDLVAIVHANPAHAGPAHPLSEERRTSWGSYHRFPSKLNAIALLTKMFGWDDPAHAHEPLIVMIRSI